MFLTTTTLLSQRAQPSLLWWSLYLKIRVGHGLAWIPCLLFDKTERGFASRVPSPPGASVRRTRGGVGGGSDPPFLSAGAARDEVNRRTQWRTINARLGDRSLHSDPCGLYLSLL